MTESWAAVEHAIADCVAQRPTEYDPMTLSVMADLLALLKSTDCVKPSIEPGYWPTFLISWPRLAGLNLGLEVFGDRVEVYRFNDRLFDVRDEVHEPGTGFSAAFIAELPIGER